MTVTEVVDDRIASVWAVADYLGLLMAADAVAPSATPLCRSHTPRAAPAREQAA